jgi:hypothetical protein
VDFSVIIIGLPRSRTAWLSAFMSQSSTFFYHEAINGCKSPSDYNKKIQGSGDSTTAFMFLDDMIKKKKKVIIKKNKQEFEDCVRWADDTYKTDNRVLLTEMNDKLESYDGLIINQSEINVKLRDIWEYLVGDAWHDKYKELSKLNIQAINHDIDKASARSFYEAI